MRRQLVSKLSLKSLLRQENDPLIALKLFFDPSKTYQHCLVSYDLIITMLGESKLFNELDLVLSELKRETWVKPTEVLFCCVIKYYSRARLLGKAVQVFDEMPLFGCPRTVKSCNTLLNGLLDCREFELFERFFAGMRRRGEVDVVSYNVMMNACRKRGDVEGALRVFDEMRGGGVKATEVTCATLVSALCEGSKMEEALKLLKDMRKVYKVKPNVYVYASLMKGFCEAKDLTRVFQLKDEMVKKNMFVTPAIYTTLISGLFKCGRKDEVHGVLEEMKINNIKPSTVTYNAIISGYCEEKLFDLALGVLNKMEENECKPDVISFNIIIRAYVNDGKLRKAMDLFEDMPRRGFKSDILSYRILVQGLIEGKKFNEAVSFLDEMIFKGFAPYAEAVNKLLKCLHQAGKLELLFEVLTILARGNYIDKDCWVLVTSIISNIEGFMTPNIKNKGGFFSVDRLFDALIDPTSNSATFTRTRKPDVTSYNDIIQAYVNEGKLIEAMSLLKDLPKRGFEPNSFSYQILIQGLMNGMNFKDAILFLDEMTLNGFAPNPAMTNKLLNWLHREGNVELLFEVLTILARGKCIDKNCWILATSIVSERRGFSSFSHLFEALTNPKPVAVTPASINPPRNPDVIKNNDIIQAYFDEGKLIEAMDLFEDMPRRGCKPDVFSYQILVQGLINGMKIQEAVLFLDEMIFKGFTPCPAVIYKLLECLHQEENMELLLEVLTILAKGCCIDKDSWILVISKVSQKGEFSSFCHLFDALTSPTSDDTNINPI